MEKKIYLKPHVQVIELEYESYLLQTSPKTFSLGTQSGSSGDSDDVQNGNVYEVCPDDID